MRALDGDCGTPPPPPGPPPVTTPDTTAPLITGLKVSPAKFRISSKRTAISAKKKKPPKGTKIKFKLSEAAKVSLKIELKGKGRKKGYKCVCEAQDGQALHALQGQGDPAPQRQGRCQHGRVQRPVGRKKLAKGRYRITATASDAARNKAKKKTVTFRIV